MVRNNQPGKTDCSRYGTTGRGNQAVHVTDHPHVMKYPAVIATDDQIASTFMSERSKNSMKTNFPANAINEMSSLKTIFNDLILAFKQAGGIRKGLTQWYRTDSLKPGTHVGTDQFGNRYFENKKYFLCRSRWVVYAERVGLDYDASQIPPKWHAWMHQTVKDPPTDTSIKKYPWMLEYQENMSGTNKQYVPYDTTPYKISAWRG
ncbi:hypothetical protein GJ496_007877 [Pomphorhynchus laevis]|nr:hypothetical protein GJ496_007877 [Pomphorhynchus laevis]